jgi:glycosyltransferase involved in cell wall biosynthesis
MQQECKDLPVTFAGELHGEELAIAFASADFFVFPSTTDTYGRVVAEAMASGLPCIVSDLGGPKEMVRKGINGMIVEANNHLALTDAIVSLACARDRQAMAVEARRFTETRSFGQAFERFWSMYAEPTPCKLSG